MSHDGNPASIDLIRWTFTINPDRRGSIEAHLADLGADVLVHDGNEFLVTWDEPEGDLADVIEALWALNGDPFDVIAEGFHRLELHTIHHVDDEASQEAA
jgi:molybdopterin-guanine dinucleotide biosynthesis protein